MRTSRGQRIGVGCLVVSLVLVVAAALPLAEAGAAPRSPHHRARTDNRRTRHSGSAPPAKTATPPTTTTLCSNSTVLSTWSLTQRAEQLIVVPVDESDPSSILPSVQQGVGGIYLSGSAGPQDLGSQLSSIEAQAPGGIRPLVMTDEEGGGVQTLGNLVGSLPWAATMAATMSTTQIRQLAEQAATAMRASGVTVDLAPVLDLAAGPGPDATHTDGPRSFSADPTTATQDGLAFAQGLEAGGVIPVMKHFPGEGSATANTDDAPASTPPLTTLEGADLLPFEAAIHAGLPAVMVGNASVPGLSEDPASLSSSVISGLLRGQLGFHGLVITDSLSAGAITAEGLSVPDAAVEAIEAGADMVLFTADDPNGTTQAVVSAIVNAVNTNQLSVAQLDSAVSQVLVAKGIDLCRT